MINRVVLVGRLTRDPEMRYTQSGIAVARFTLACDRPFGGQDGKKETDFIDCTVWRKQAENVAQYLKKGNMAGVDGRLQISSYEGQDGQKRQRAEVVADSVRFLELKGQGKSSAPSQPRQETPQSNFTNDPFSGGGKIDLSDDDLPF
ncbi:single-stranded DNA-binding protein [Exiguobacterium aestuarii]|uniref:single-stranded DNA-binding protein n=1 Tax=Exiguobacterium aestuarii TaxID=273527 RepID=UPI001CD4FD5B|nr:single-stranded DNA-binding protein [Exiguobacterium aestuarii]MCA0980209.1 single-stranded DNA-binding protein [Exiguobacterium aestuarii]